MGYPFCKKILSISRVVKTKNYHEQEVMGISFHGNEKTATTEEEREFINQMLAFIDQVSVKLR